MIKIKIGSMLLMFRAYDFKSTMKFYLKVTNFDSRITCFFYEIIDDFFRL